MTGRWSGFTRLREILKQHGKAFPAAALAEAIGILDAAARERRGGCNMKVTQVNGSTIVIDATDDPMRGPQDWADKLANEFESWSAGTWAGADPPSLAQFIRNIVASRDGLWRDGLNGLHAFECNAMCYTDGESDCPFAKRLRGLYLNLP